jgi:hypothetical protein
MPKAYYNVFKAPSSPTIVLQDLLKFSSRSHTTISRLMGLSFLPSFSHTCCSITQHDTQCTHNVTLRRVRESLLPRKCSKDYVCLCARAYVRAWPGAWACACWCAYVALLIQHSAHMRHTVPSTVASLAPSNFSTLSHKRHDFRKKKLLNIKCVLTFSTTFI